MSRHGDRHIGRLDGALVQLTGKTCKTLVNQVPPSTSEFSDD